MASIKLLHDALNPWTELQNYQAEQLTSGEYGALATFVGSMRDFNQGDDVKAMHLEHYPGMTETQLAGVREDAMQQWPLLDCLIVHRVGNITPGEPIVLTACWSAHRAAAFEACRFTMEALKTRATFWKRETLQDDQNRWVEKNTPGY